MMIGVATCSDTPIAAVKTGTSPTMRFGVGRIALAPVFSKAAQYAAAHLADFPSVRFDSVRVVIRGTPDTTQVIKDTTVFFGPSSSDLTLELNVPVQNDGQRFQAGMDYRGPDGVVFHGVQIVQSHRPDQPAPAQQPILINYVGAGSKVKSITVAPRTLSLVGNQTSALTVTAVDSNNSTVAVPLAFSSSSETIATVSNTGLVQAQNRRGSATITVQTPSGVTDAAAVSVSLAPSAISVVSGSGQSGRVGSTLANPAVVQVAASDGIGVAGVTVIFASPVGGSVSPTTATTDANGRASTTMKLGPTAGPQGFTATAVGLSTAISATATAGDPSAMTIVSGNNQTDSVRAALAPLSVRVSDSFNNPVSGASVSWTKSGGGSLGSATTTTNSDGIATNSYTLGAVLGTETVTAAAGSAAATFTFTANGGRPASIVAVSGGGQSGRISQALGSPLVVKVTDASGNPVRDAAITWTAQNATIASTTPSDASGQASANVQLGNVVGSATVTAAIAGGVSVGFTATVQAGTPASILVSTQPTNGVANQPLAPIGVALRDAGNNPADGTVTIALAGNPTGATLGGTLSQGTTNGAASFGNLTIDRVGAGYTLRVSINGLTATTKPFDVTAGRAARMTIVAGDSASATVNTMVATPPSVKLVDASNNPIVGARVKFSPTDGSGSVSPGDSVTTNAQGIATLASWTLGTAMGTQAVVASSPGVQPVTFTANARPGNAARLQLKNKASLQMLVVPNVLLSPQPIIQVTDEYGNAVPAGRMEVRVSPATAAGVTVSASPVTLDSATGSKSFTDVRLSGSGLTQLVFIEGSGRIKPDTSNTIRVAGQATMIKLVPDLTSISLVAGQTPSLPQVKAEDANGNGVANVKIRVVVDSGTAPNVAFVGVDSFTTNGLGLASITVPPPTGVGTYRLTATSAGIANALIVTATVKAGSAYKVAFENRAELQKSVISGSTLSPQPRIGLSIVMGTLSR